MVKMNDGKLLLYYLGEGSGNTNLQEVDIVKPATLERNHESQLVLSFEIDYPGLAFTGPVNFKLDKGDSQYKDLFLFMFHVAKLSDAEFLIYADLVWNKEDDTENFEVLARFKGVVPEGLKYKVCPSIN
jgi:hypothetical protein